MFPIKIILILLSTIFSTQYLKPITITKAKIEHPNKPKPIVFIAGFDEDDNRYYTNAARYFEERQFTVIYEKYSLEEIVCWLNQAQSEQQQFNEIHIVSHSNPWRGLSLKTLKDGDRITLASLARDKNEIPTLNIEKVNPIKIIFHACGLGKNRDLLQAIKTSIDVHSYSQLYASPYFNVFGSPYAAHYLADAYFVCYPTAHSPGPAALAEEFVSDYPQIQVNWQKALSTKTEEKPGQAYRYRFNIPVVWKTEYATKAAIPMLKTREDIMDAVAENEALATELLQLNIPLEKFRWRSQVEGNTLIIKGKTTVQCVLKPLTEEEIDMEYVVPDFEDRSFYVRI